MILETNERECSGDIVLRIDKFEDYNFSDNAGHIHYSLMNYRVELGWYSDGTPVPGDGGVGQAITIYKELYQNGIIDLTDKIVNQWGADDTVIFNFAAEQLGLTLV